MTAGALIRHGAQKNIDTTRFIGNIHEIYMIILFFYALNSYIFCRQHFYILTITLHAVLDIYVYSLLGITEKKPQNNETTCGS